MKKITSVLVCAGLGLTSLAGGMAVKSLPDCKIASAAFMPGITVGFDTIRFDDMPVPDMLMPGLSMPCPMPFHFFGMQEYGEEQTAAHKVYRELKKEINHKYEDKNAELLRAYKAELEEAHVTVLGDKYSELKTEIKGLCDQYKGLSNGFYSNDEYVSLKNELDTLMAELITLEAGSEEYITVKEKVDEVWGRISVFAGEINSQKTTLHSQKREAKETLRTLICDNETALNEQFEIITKKYLEDAKVIQSSFRMELEVLQKSLGVCC